ncbi:MAG: site-specific integrase [Verrucomicrobia bacterium]|nr:site-specific integrase [Verrucomicrobiota bacterium]
MALLNAARLNPDDLTPGYNLRYATGQRLLPLSLLGGFAGLRTAEVQRQLWSDINLERGFIRVTAAKGNTAQKRLVPISDNLRQWLSACPHGEGLCCDYPRPNEAIQRLAKRANIKWKHNALRHSFISYRVAQTQNVGQVALEAGNSPKMIFRHYRELVTPEEAKAWFAIQPHQAANVVPLQAAAAK